MSEKKDGPTEDSAKEFGAGLGSGVATAARDKFLTPLDEIALASAAGVMLAEGYRRARERAGETAATGWLMLVLLRARIHSEWELPMKVNQ